MGQALDRDGRVIGEAYGETKRDVFDQLSAAHPGADELRIKTSRYDPGTRSVVELKDKVEDLFTYHKPEGTQPEHYEAIRTAAKAFAHVVVANTPASADQTAAIRKLRECVMTANAAIALKGVS